MSNSNYRRGVTKEYEAMAQLEKNGYATLRMAGSHGVFDIVAFDSKTIRMIQCKREKNKDKKIEDPDKAYPEDTKHIREIKVPGTVSREIWIWIDRNGWKKYRLYNVDDCQYWKLI